MSLFYAFWRLNCHHDSLAFNFVNKTVGFCPPKCEDLVFCVKTSMIHQNSLDDTPKSRFAEIKSKKLKQIKQMRQNEIDL